ncbi:malate dehydrogenase [Candidatus Kaiserbacteria bacterium RIFCSPHIGHO2_02_FULL_59_21]|uniref:Malate dehydrogenase n=1 Tax=Candidatus Kaiserbacteria bacterium RIFCSPHIGHO2_02_FULL_59_21 TaxID=1798500 RepID=A0A1F6DZ43_9BACT|nr:MAG: malate dehydrogenase [Candidatus Kaiserbacteria bacterium RIFCSPHIGHO2_01_FULL_58_22]OGG66668.1 MAG: malate dehydrogenase [Candidatus Kaiserbacteria bacterium RIFCSPHIGHO2_02_FULL_59_21]OGG78958.1 MAG: malate dehydrogenase [Candidatus Kaiserbacteria bacterium RIFCSPLOWO2_01_FULL_59_34]OGG84419.1 MAG: malate dehydrogenase [Candidatus Kaiserbacteria bacterium RIFCSPLOWO2_02_FULL_59_19]
MAKTDIAKKALALHKKLGGKIRIVPAAPIRNRAELSLVYTPGVAAVSSYVAKNPKEARRYTMKGRSVAVISDGSAVLGLGNIGALGALPVMEGKAAIFKTFADIDTVPIVLDTQDADEIVETVLRIAPAFGGINLEDIAAPKCFEIERRVIDALDIPVMHDDQHGTAIVVLAGLLNALKVVGKKIGTARIVISGAGAAGTATAHLLHAAGALNIVMLDSKGVISSVRDDLTPHKKELAKFTNPDGVQGGLREALNGSDVLIGVSGPGLATAEDIRRMAKGAIVLAMANPIPEIMPDEAKRGGASVVGTGRSDFPNQINNSLAFPGIFRGALDHKVTKITEAMKLKAAHAIAALVPKPTATRIVPDMFDKRVAKAVAKVIR